MDDTELMRLARKRVAMKQGFYIHLAVFVAVNALLAGINVLQGSGRPWSLFPLAGWGLGLAIHGFVTWLSLPGSSRSAAMLEREVRTLRERR